MVKYVKASKIMASKKFESAIMDSLYFLQDTQKFNECARRILNTPSWERPNGSDISYIRSVGFDIINYLDFFGMSDEDVIHAFANSDYYENFQVSAYDSDAFLDIVSKDLDDIRSYCKYFDDIIGRTSEADDDGYYEPLDLIRLCWGITFNPSNSKFCSISDKFSGTFDSVDYKLSYSMYGGDMAFLVSADTFYDIAGMDRSYPSKAITKAIVENIRHDSWGSYSAKLQFPRTSTLNIDNYKAYSGYRDEYAEEVGNFDTNISDIEQEISDIQEDLETNSDASGDSFYGKSALKKIDKLNAELTELRAKRAVSQEKYDMYKRLLKELVEKAREKRNNR